jgi:hypothetical protein
MRLELGPEASTIAGEKREKRKEKSPERINKNAPKIAHARMVREKTPLDSVVRVNRGTDVAIILLFISIIILAYFRS